MRIEQALARAIYSRLDPVVLDDVLSGVDPKTAGLITERLLGESGYFRTANRSAVIVTSSCKFCKCGKQVIMLMCHRQRIAFSTRRHCA